jgi:hypothetical protein
MNCDEAKRHWSLYHDSEGDAELHFCIGEHLAVCPQCAQWFDQQSRLECLLADKLRSQSPTPAIWDQVLHKTGLAPKQPAAARRWSWLLGVAACLLLVVAVSWFALRPATPRGYDLANMSAQWHQRLEAGEETLQFRSESDLEVEDYLRQRVPFPVRCPPRKDAGFVVQGAGVFRIADQPAAYLFGHVDATPVSIFVLSRDKLEAFPAQKQTILGEGTHRSQEGAYQVVMAGIDRNAVLAIGQTATSRLDRVLHAYGTYPHEH